MSKKTSNYPLINLITDKKFKPCLTNKGGYNAENVDLFLDDVVKQLTLIYNELENSRSKIRTIQTENQQLQQINRELEERVRDLENKNLALEATSDTHRLNYHSKKLSDSN
ncbi:DivIVA domain-containing protein [Mycoplasmoides fastidiosum]|uniref:DivIVA domain-containing protein n=1 Tax=Mycoplasmoides fastidiosum TaxID=92758 RepID=A0ABU0LZB0_9BACT|nr:DivIVA domain-containing protein [Mycoplasmoides fastidiosum]MDQ0514023.1 DivIVA domain-containing protein [Mycoplasmoides fastidiosum]UUD37567.1 DivIVA domain-containing protein [Mycoplasmoides fastidiosum]